MPTFETQADRSSGESAIANVRFQPTSLRLRDREGDDQRSAIGLLQITSELLESEPRRGTLLDAVFEQLTIVIAYIARHVV